MARGGDCKFYAGAGGEEGCIWEFGGPGVEYLFGLGHGVGSCYQGGGGFYAWGAMGRTTANQTYQSVHLGEFCLHDVLYISGGFVKQGISIKNYTKR